MSEQFEFKGPEVQKEEIFPEDFPMYPTGGHVRWLSPRRDRSLGMELLFEKGELDKDEVTRMWYGVANDAKMNTLNLPKEDPLNIAIGGFMKLKGIAFDKCFKESGTYLEVACLRESNPERQKLLDFQADLIMRSFVGNVRKIVDSVPELKEATEHFVKAKIKYDADHLRRETLELKESAERLRRETLGYNNANSENKEKDDEISEKIKEEYLSAEKEFDRVMEEQNIQY